MSNIIEQYSKLFAALDTSQTFQELLHPDGYQSCPLEGQRTLGQYGKGLSDFNEKNIEKIVLVDVITKKGQDKYGEILKGIMVAKTFFKVQEGDAAIRYYQVIKARENIIFSIDSFWRVEDLKNLSKKHPELKRFFL